MLSFLDVAQTTAELTSVRRTVLGTAVAALSSGVAVIWQPSKWTRVNPFRHRHLRRRIFLAVAPGAIGLAVLPGMLPLDNIISPHEDSGSEQHVHAAHGRELPGAGIETEMDDEYFEMHAARGQESPGACCNLLLVSGPGQFMAPEPLIVAPVLLNVPVLITVASLAGRGERPEVRPPRSLLTADT